MATWADVRRLALQLPAVVEDEGARTTAWRVGSRAFAWERLLRPAELAQLTRPTVSPALGLRLPDVGAGEALVASQPDLFFAVAGYLSHPMVLLRVEAASYEDLDEALTEAWLCRAPRKLARAFLDGRA